jgi:hypothetical protein
MNYLPLFISTPFQLELDTTPLCPSLELFSYFFLPGGVNAFHFRQKYKESLLCSCGILIVLLEIIRSPWITTSWAEMNFDLSFLLHLQQPLNGSLYFDTYYNEYGKIIITFLAAAFICFLLFILSYFFSFANQKEYEKGSEYECGFEPFDSATRQPYDVHFYMVGILFLIFDVEIALLFP